MAPHSCSGIWQTCPLGDRLMPRISADEYRQRMESLKARIEEAGLDLFLVSSPDSIYYLTGAGFEPLERPFFLLVRPRLHASLLVPKLDEQHMRKAHGIRAENIHTYAEYPAPQGRGWRARLHDLVDESRRIGVEETLCLQMA